MLAAEERVELLLRTYEEARVSYGVGSTGQGVRLMPSMWHEGSYAELEQALLILRESSRRQLWWHVCQRYRFGVEQVRILPVNRRKKLGPEFVMPANCELIAGGPAVGSKHAVARIYLWRDDVDMGKVARGIDVLCTMMYGGRTDRIQLPQLILRRRLGLPVERELVA